MTAEGAPRVVRDGDVVTLTMCRPAKRNALSRDHLTQLLAAVTEVGESDAAGLVIAAEGPVFSAGHDFADVAGRPVPEVRSLLQLCTELMQTLHVIPQVVLARVHALATAAGCQLVRSEEHTSELQSRQYLVCCLLLEKIKTFLQTGDFAYFFSLPHLLHRLHSPFPLVRRMPFTLFYLKRLLPVFVPSLLVGLPVSSRE